MSDLASFAKTFATAKSLYDLIVRVMLRAFPMNFMITRKDLPEVGRSAMEIADEFFDRLPEFNAKPQCKSGCSFCCYVGVDATIAELWAIGTHLKETLSPEEFEATKAHVRSIVDRLEGFDNATRIPHKIPCSMLDVEQGTCRIYSCRPLLCRAYNSLDRDRCEEGWGGDAEWTIPQEIYQQNVYCGASHGLNLGLRQAQFKDGYIEFNQGLLKVLEEV